MKKQILAVATCGVMLAGGAMAARLLTSCPSGYTTVVEEYMTIADSACPTGHTSAGDASSCLVSSPDRSCIMYAPAGESFKDTTGTYEYTSACPLT